MTEAIYTVCAFDEMMDDERVRWATHVTVLAANERQAISRAKKMVKRKEYRAVTVTTLEVVSANSGAAHRLADAMHLIRRLP